MGLRVGPFCHQLKSKAVTQTGGCEGSCWQEVAQEAQGHLESSRQNSSEPTSWWPCLRREVLRTDSLSGTERQQLTELSKWILIFLFEQLDLERSRWREAESGLVALSDTTQTLTHPCSGSYRKTKLCFVTGVSPRTLGGPWTLVQGCGSSLRGKCLMSH